MDAVPTNLVEQWLKENREGNYQKKIARRKDLHANSIWMVAILERYSLLRGNLQVFELGCGSGRNLSYLVKENPSIRVTGSDLNEGACFQRMSNILKEYITFIQSESLELMQGEVFPVDLFICSDHLMHLEDEKGSEILHLLRDKWKPDFIFLRESLSPGKQASDRFLHWYFVHDYDMLNSEYEILVEMREEHGDDNQITFLTRLLRRK